jgi:tetratricopeptide (TPR) repeat protein
VGICTSIPPGTIQELKHQGITEAALATFFQTLGQNKVPPNELDRELRTIAQNYLDLKTRTAQFSSEDPEIKHLIRKAQNALEVANFPLAEQLFNQASQQDEAAAHKLQETAATRFASAAAAQAANGDVQAIQLDFIKAQAYYRKALDLLPPTERELRGQYLNSLGSVLSEAAIRTSGSDIQQFLHDAVAAYREALTVRTKAQLPQDWAMTQNNLGTVLGDQGTRTGGKEGTELLAEAVTAYRAALTVRTKEALPQDWATTQNNLGIVLADQGVRTRGEEGKRLFKQATEAYQLALQVRTKDTLPVEWEQTMNNLKEAEKAFADLR